MLIANDFSLLTPLEVQLLQPVSQVMAWLIERIDFVIDGLVKLRMGGNRKVTAANAPAGRTKVRCGGNATLEPNPLVFLLGVGLSCGL